MAKVKQAEAKQCSICQRPYLGLGNNAWPVNKGRCCDTCNLTTVLVARINLMLYKEASNVVKNHKG